MRVPEFEELATLHHDIAECAVDGFNKYGELAPAVFICDVKVPGLGTGISQMPNEMACEFLAGTGKTKAEHIESQHLFARMVRSMLLPGPLREQMEARGEPLPNVIVQIAEAWFVLGATEEERATMPKDLSDHPGRGEAIMCTVHTAEGSYLGVSKIDATTRRATLGELRPAPMHGGLVMPQPERVLH
jgi:hypothetical protein